MSAYNTIDIIFEQATANAGKPYRLWSDPDQHYAHNIIARVADQRQNAPWFIKKEDWGEGHVVDQDNHGRLYRAELSFYGKASEVSCPVAVKWMRGEHAIKGLRKEASMYTGPLRRLQGEVVPRFYGFFTGTVENVDIGCIVLEWCEDWDLTHKPPPKEEMNERLKAVRRLHAAGVKHGKLYKTRDSVGPFDSRHFLHDKHGATRIVGFQHASLHTCAGGLGKHDDVKVCLDGKCRELCYVEVHWRRACGLAPEAQWQPF